MHNDKQGRLTVFDNNTPFASFMTHILVVVESRFSHNVVGVPRFFHEVESGVPCML